MRQRFLLFCIIAALAAPAPPAGAITNGRPDADHPYVGLLVTLVDGGEREPVCSGTLIAPQVFLTAAHCTAFLDENALPAFVTFDPSFDQSSPLLGGTALTHPAFDPLLPLQEPDTHDIALVLLDEPVTNLGFAELPEKGVLDALAPDREAGRQTFTVVGYGALGLLAGGGPPRYDFPNLRQATTTSLITLRSALTDGFNLQMTGSPGDGQGGICFGDSGGPVFLADSSTIVAINSFLLNFNCAGSAFAFRLDTEAALAFLAPYL